MVGMERNYSAPKTMTERSFLARLMNVTPASILRRARLLPRAANHAGPRAETIADIGRIKSVALRDVLRDRPIIRMDGSYFYVDGSLPWQDIIPFLSIVVDRAPKTVVEIGTLHGHTTRLLAINLPDSQIHTIDLPVDPDLTTDPEGMQKDDFHLIRGRRLGEEFRSDPTIKNVTQHIGDTATLSFPAGELFFIDGSHTYEYVRNDTEKAMAIPKATAFIWHDCDLGHPAVVRYLCELVDYGLPVLRIAETNLAVLYR